MKYTLFLLFALSLAVRQPAAGQAAAQEPKVQAPVPGQTPGGEKKEAPAGEQKETPEAKPEEAAPTPAPTAEQWLTGSVDFGFRWIVSRDGDVRTYRSVVNLGQGPKLFAADLQFQNPNSRKYFDRINVRAYSWGGEPYNTAAVDARREGLYQFNFDYRNIAYYNFLPTFADPLLQRGIFLDERSFDTFIRTSDARLDFFPGHRIIPYLGYNRNSWRGSGITTLVLQANEYPIDNHIQDRTDNYRGGVRFEFNRFHVTLEQGAINFADDQAVRWNGPRNLGNLPTPFFGQTLFLDAGDQAFHIRSDSIYSRAIFTASPFGWMDVFGQFLYSQPHSTTAFSQRNFGNFFDLVTLGFYNSELLLASADAKQPHPSGSVGTVLRPLPRLRIFESFLTNRLHNASSSLLTDQLLSGGALIGSPITATADRLVTNYNQQELNLLYDLTSKLSVRGGWRYVFGDSTVPAALVIESLGTEQGKLRRHVALAGVNFRWGTKLRANADAEVSPGDRTYFRTSLDEYQRERIRVAYEIKPSLLLSVKFNLLSNDNPAPSKYDFSSRDSSIALNWIPSGGKRVSVLAEYTRTTIRSDISFLVPSTLDTDISSYRDNGHTGIALADFALPGSGALQPRIRLGGSFVVTSGSGPVRYYQPLAGFIVPVGKHVQWNSEWRWYALTEPFTRFEGFRSNQLITSLRLIM